MNPFVTYTKGAVMYVTNQQYESEFLNWLNRVDSSVGYQREVRSQVGVPCAPTTIHAVAKKEATILKLVAPE